MATREEERADPYDVVVVGGGPGGATAAFLLSEFGFDVLVVDKATFPRNKLCGGLLTDKTLRLLDRVYGEAAEELLSADVLNYASREYRVFVGETKLLDGAIDDPFYFVERTVYDRYLLERARDAGATVLEGVGVTEVDADAGRVVTGDGRAFVGDHVIGADGANSRVRRQLFREGRVDDDGWRENLAMAVEAYVPRDRVDLDVDDLVVHFGVLEWGYGWVFPNRDKLLIGVGGLNERNDNFRELLEGYLDLLGEGDLSPEIHGHPVPFGNYLDDPTAGAVLLIGDAAGTVDAITGEGIFYAQRTGELAAWAVRRAATGEVDDAATAYRELLHRYVHPELEESRRGRTLLWAGPERPRFALMRLWMRLLGRYLFDTIHGFRIYRLFRRKGRQRHDSVHT